MEFITTHEVYLVNGQKAFPFMDRKQEVITILKSNEFGNSKGETVVVAGQSGLGKTTFVSAFVKSLTGEVDIGLLLGASSAHQTEQIDAVLLRSKSASHPHYLILDVAGYDHGIAFEEANECNGLAFSIANKVVLTLDEDINNIDVVRLANFARIGDASTAAFNTAPHARELILVSSCGKGTPAARFIHREPPANDPTYHFTNKLAALTERSVVPARDFLQSYFSRIVGAALPLIPAARRGGNVVSVPAAEVISLFEVMVGFTSLIELTLQKSDTYNANLNKCSDVAERLAASVLWMASESGQNFISVDPTDSVSALVAANIMRQYSDIEDEIIKDHVRGWAATRQNASAFSELEARELFIADRVRQAREPLEALYRNYFADGVSDLDSVPAVDVLLERLTRSVEVAWAAEKEKITQLKRNEDAATQRAAAAQAKILRDAAVLSFLQARVEATRESSLSLGDHNLDYRNGHFVLGIKTRDHEYKCNNGCGLFQSGGGRPGGSCPRGTRSYSQPTWEEYKTANNYPSGAEWLEILRTVDDEMKAQGK